MLILNIIAIEVENLKEYLNKIPEYDHIILTSVNGVNNFFDLYLK